MKLSLRTTRIAVEEARREAFKDAKAQNRWVRSRGTFLCTADSDGQCEPSPEAEAFEWDGTLRAIHEMVNDVLAKYPDVEKIYISGGYDGADTFEDLYRFDNYEPWVAAWDITVWTKEGGYVAR